MATFSNLIFNTAGNYTLTVSDGSLAAATTGSVTVSPAAASKLVITQTPGSGTAGQALGTAFQIAVADAFGNVVTSNSSTLAVTIANGPAGFASGSTTSIAAVSGIATFSNLIFNTAGSYTLSVSDGSLTGATSGSFPVSPAAASYPVNCADAVDRCDEPSPEPVAAGRDQGSVRQRRHWQQLIRDGRPGKRSRDIRQRQHDVGDGRQRRGHVQQPDAQCDGHLHAERERRFVDRSHLRQRHDQQLLDRQPVGHHPIADRRYRWPGAGNGPLGCGGERLRQHRHVEYINGHVTVLSGPGGFASGSTTSVAAVNGVASFSNLIFNTAGTYTLSVSDGSLTGATTSAITISPAAASKLAITQAPTTGTAGQASGTSLTVAIEDAFGNVVTGNSSSVTVALASGPAGFASGSTTSAAAVNGVATFSKLIFNTAGTYTLSVSGASLSGATSGSFTVSAAAASKLLVNQAPSAGVAGQALSPSLTVSVEDAFGNVVTGNSSTVTVSSAGPAQLASNSTASVAAVNGIATFSALYLDATGSYTLSVSDGSLTGATTGSFTVSSARRASSSSQTLRARARQDRR